MSQLASSRKYFEYFDRHPSALQICFLVRNAIDAGISATEAASALGKALTTTAAALNDLEQAGIFTKNREGRERKFRPQDPRTFSQVIDEILARTQGTRGRVLPYHVLLAKVEALLQRSLRTRQLSIISNKQVETGFAPALADFIIPESNTALILNIITHRNSLYTMIGRIITLLSSWQVNVLISVNLYTKSDISDNTEQALPRIISTGSFFAGKELKIIKEQVDERDFGKQEAVERIFHNIVSILQ